MRDNKPYIFKGREEDRSEVKEGIEADVRADHEPTLVDAGGNAVGKATKKRRVRPPGDFMAGFCTREELVKYLAGAVNATSEKMYEQMSSEIADNLEHMEDIILRRVIYVLETKTWRWKVKQLWRKVFPAKLKIDQIAAPTFPDWSATTQAMSAHVAALDHGTDANPATDGHT